MECIDWDVGGVVQQWLSHDKHRDSCCSAHEAGCLSSPNLVLGSEKNPGELSDFDWNPEEIGFSSGYKAG